MGVADGLRMRKMNNCQKVNFVEIDAGGGPETGILLVVALYRFITDYIYSRLLHVHMHR